ncbi:HNH endonuclease [Paenibacillus caui]|uniref:HNH endonuclease n=1 Tax=Paenibacillus caui TaxID=2873927 RepID=UPI001CA8A266|nr:HNH endonuclease [Paenibacillus caui]
MTITEQPQTKTCSYCLKIKPVTDFRRRTGRRAGTGSRRGACKECREQRAETATATAAAARLTMRNAPAKSPADHKPNKPNKPKAAGAEPKRSGSAKAPRPLDLEDLKPLRSGMIRMRGKSDKGRRWQQEIDPELAKLLVKEKAAVVVNRHTIRRLFTNREFRQFILQRDHYTCHYCGAYGDTIDHLLPRAKGGHTTPVNCVCACNLCNQTKADRDVDDFLLNLPHPR